MKLIPQLNEAKQFQPELDAVKNAIAILKKSVQTIGKKSSFQFRSSIEKLEASYNDVVKAHGDQK